MTKPSEQPPQQPDEGHITGVTRGHANPEALDPAQRVDGVEVHIEIPNQTAVPLSEQLDQLHEDLVRAEGPNDGQSHPETTPSAYTNVTVTSKAPTPEETDDDAQH